MKYLIRLAQGLTPESIGNKAYYLIFIHKHKFRIPRTYVITSLAYLDYIDKGQAILESLREELKSLPGKEYAVRSSTLVEDSSSHSFAGQFQTFTDVKGIDNLLNSVVKVWESAYNASETDYHKKVYNGQEKILFAVIIQEMVRSKLSGVSFSKNPVTGQNEIVIEAVEGLGEELVQKGVTPFRWRLAGKKLLEGPSDSPFIQVVRKVAADTNKLKLLFGRHVDIEWAFDGKALFYLQLRSVVGEDRIDVYSNRIAQEMLPGQIKPLVWSVNIPLVTGTKIDLLSEVFGPMDVQPEELTKAFYFRTYFNMTRLGEIFSKLGLPPESLESMMGGGKSGKHMSFPGWRVLRHTSRVIRFVRSKLAYEKQYLKEYPVLKSSFQTIDARLHDNFNLGLYKDYFDELFSLGKRVAYANTVVPLLMRMQHKKLMKEFERIGVSYELLDFQKDFPELAEYSPTLLMDRIRIKFGKLPEHIKLQARTLTDLTNSTESVDLLKDFNLLLTRFGHFSDSGNDCSVPKWEENPDQLLLMTLSIAVGEGSHDMKTIDRISLPFWKRSRLKKLYNKAGRFKLYREQISSLYIYGYGLFRSLFLATGNILVSKSIIDNRDDIFYLTRNELDEIVKCGILPDGQTPKDIIADRKKEMKECEDLILPAMIYGDKAPIIERGSIRNFSGIATSPGSYSGKTRIIRKSIEFDQVVEGEVLIIPFSDVSWTPILSKAGAIVSESGGMLSHCSIISRELGIPSLVSVENACALENGLFVTVDGSNGILTVHDYE